MNKKSLHILKAFCLLLAAIAFGTSVFAQGVTLTESFDGTTFPPTGWEIKTAVAGFGQLWTRNTGAGAIATPNSGAADAAFRRVGGAAANVLTQNLITPAFDLSGIGANTASVNFFMFNDTNFVNSLDSMIVWINTSDTLLGATRIGAVGRYTSVANGWNQHNFNYPAGFNGTTNYLIFQAVSDPNNTRRIYLDDVEWTAYPPACSGIPNSGNILSTIPVICGGLSGSSNLSLSAPITNASGISYNWEYSTNGTSGWTGFGTSYLPTANTGTISTTMYYHCIVTCNATSQSYTTPVDSVVVSSQPKPTVVITPSSTTYCTGGSPVSLVASGASTYSWTASANGGLTGTTGTTVTGAPTAGGGFGGNTANYTVIGTNNGCSDTVTVNIRVAAKPALYNPLRLYHIVGNAAITSDSVCIGQMYRISCAAGGFGGGNPWTYSWSNGKITRVDTITPSLSTTSYTIIATDTVGGCSVKDTGIINLIVNPSPVASFTYTVSGNVVTFTNTSTDAASYSWNFGDGSAIDNTQNPSHTYITINSETVTLSIVGITCGDTTITKTVSFSSGINAVGLNKFNLVSYPNPANDATTVYFTAEATTAQLVLMNTLGQTIFSKTLSPKNSNSFSEKISTSNLPAGIYMIQIFAKN